MNRVDETDLDPNSWAEHSAHLVQDTPLLRLLYVGLPLWVQKYPKLLLLMIWILILVLFLTAGKCLLLRGNIIILRTSCSRGRCLQFL